MVALEDAGTVLREFVGPLREFVGLLTTGALARGAR
jgi:hypothetical protein